MTRTSPVVAFGLYETVIKQALSASCTDKQTFSNLDDLRSGNTASRPYATFEPDFWLLDGEYKFKPSDALTHVGLMSLSMSDVDGVFGTAPVLTLNFSGTYTTTGLTLNFSQDTGDWADSIRVVYYNGASVLRTDDYVVTDWQFPTGQAVTNFNKIIITFYSTNKPFRHLRLMGLDFGTLTYFRGTDIKSASVVEEVNPPSVEVTANAFEVSLFSTTPQFSIIDPTGDYAALKLNQPLDVYEEVGNDTVYMGQFYLKGWENVSENEVKFTCVDRIGVLGDLQYNGGFWETATDVESILDALMLAAKTPYELDEDLVGATIQGWIPSMSYREALLQICFAIGAYVDCARSGAVKIRKMNLIADLPGYDNTIGQEAKSLSGSLTLKPLVTGVSVTSYKYIKQTVDVLFESYLAAGTHTILFSAPATSVGIVGGSASITSKAAHWAIVSVSISGTITIQGELYAESEAVYSVNMSGLDTSVPKNVIKIEDTRLIHAGNATTTAQRLYDYYQQRYLLKTKLYAPVASAGTSVLIDTLQSKQIGGIVEKMTLDLTGGFTAQTEINGVVVE